MRRHLTYANVMATTGVFLALGGASYAAIKLPANSVGSKQIKDGAVTSADIKNHSIKAGDFKGGLPSGPRGPRGQAGERGEAAAKYWPRIKGGTSTGVISSSGGITVTRSASGNARSPSPWTSPIAHRQSRSSAAPPAESPAGRPCRPARRSSSTPGSGRM